MRYGRPPSPRRIWVLTRRRLMLALPAVGLASRGTAKLDLATPRIRSTLGAFVDVIVPPDVTPGAADLGIHNALLALAPRRTNYPALLSEGTAWLDESAGGNFAGAHPKEQQRVVKIAFTARPGTLPRVFVEFLREDIMRLYYAEPQSWDGLIDGPPQPMGYPDANLPPDFHP